MESSLYLIGTSFKQAHLDRVALVQWSDTAAISPFLARLREMLAVDEVFFLQTCNRREFYFYAPEVEDAESLKTSVLAMLAEELDREIEPVDFYALRGLDVVRHAFRVASSLDSMVLGETEIMKQIKDQATASARHGHLGRRLDELMRTALWVSKQVRQRTSITRNVVSIASLAYRRTLDYLAHRPTKRVVFVGAGHFIQSILPTFTKSPELELTIVNRSDPERLAAVYGATPMRLAEFRERPVDCDVMITATGASEPVFDRDFMAMRGKVLVMDAGLPRDVDDRVVELADVEYLDLEEMEAVLTHNRAAREAEIPKTEPIFDEGLAKLRERWLECDLATYSKEISTHYRETGERALAYLMKQDMPDLDDAQRQMLEAWTHNLIGKLTKIPILGLKGVAREHGNTGVSSFTRQVAERAPLFRG